MKRSADDKEAHRPQDEARARREERLKAALRVNMQRRKAQMRARRAAEEAGADPASRPDTARKKD